MKKFLPLVALLALGGIAASQVNVVPQTGVASGIITRPTYSSTTLALPPAASATDVACIAGSATKTIYIDKIRVSGSAGTLVSLPVTLLRRATVDTGGTAATTTANWANNIGKNDSLNAAATATLISYSANPTITDSSPTYLRSQYVTLPATAAGTSINPIDWTWSDAEFSQRPTLRGIAQQFCLNLNAVSVTSGLMEIVVQWTEE